MAKPNILVRTKKAKAEELFNGGRLHEADAQYAGICQSVPGDAESWAMRGLIHRKLGAFGQAEAFCRQALKLKPEYAWGHHLLGSALQCQGRMQEALASYRKAIALNPGLAEAHYFLGNALRETGALREAVESYRQATRLQPDFVEALSNLGAALITLGDTQEAASVLNRAIMLRPNTPQILCNQGHVLQRDGQLPQALEKYQRALSLDPESLDTIGYVAALLEKTGQIEEAQALVERHALRAPDNPTLLIVAAKLARRAKRIDEAITLLERALEKAPAMEAAGEVHFLLGQLYDRQGEADRAYAHLVEGNRLAAVVGELRNAGQRPYLERVEMMRTYLTDELASLADATVDDDHGLQSPVFLLGFPRSGTTLLEQILDSHPALQALEEKGTVAAMVRAFDDMAQGRANALAELTEEEVTRLRATYYEEVARYIQLQPGNLLIDKMPLNTVNVHLIWRVFPQAKFILAIRHPCDASFSCFMQDFFLNEAMSSFLTLESTARVYRAVMQTWVEAAAKLPLDFHRIRYEDLVADFEGETRALLDFLGVGWHDRVLGHTEHALKRGTIKTPSYHQVTQPIYQHAKYRWKRYAKQFEPVMPMLQPYIDYFGYRE
jgi:tetratricopeptide (TPR) repeat protein